MTQKPLLARIPSGVSKEEYEAFFDGYASALLEHITSTRQPAGAGGSGGRDRSEEVNEENGKDEPTK